MKKSREKEERIRIKHNKKLLLAIIVVIILLVIVIYLISKNKNDINQENECETDKDCVPDTCCHPDSCVPRENKPNCDKVFCSMVCQGPLDCNMGHCGCVNNRCEVISHE